MYTSFSTLSDVSFFPVLGLEIFIFPMMKVFYSNCKKNVGAGISTLICIFNGLGPSIFRRRMERTRPMREKIDGKVFISRQSRHINRKKMSKESSRTESCILGALSQLDEFLLNPVIQGHSGTALGTSRNTLSTNQGTNEDDS